MTCPTTVGAVRHHQDHVHHGGRIPGHPRHTHGSASIRRVSRSRVGRPPTTRLHTRGDRLSRVEPWHVRTLLRQAVTHLPAFVCRVARGCPEPLARPDELRSSGGPGYSGRRGGPNRPGAARPIARSPGRPAQRPTRDPDGRAGLGAALISVPSAFLLSGRCVSCVRTALFGDWDRSPESREGRGDRRCSLCTGTRIIPPPITSSCHHRGRDGRSSAPEWTSTAPGSPRWPIGGRGVDKGTGHGPSGRVVRARYASEATAQRAPRRSTSRADRDHASGVPRGNRPSHPRPPTGDLVYTRQRRGSTVCAHQHRKTAVAVRAPLICRSCGRDDARGASRARTARMRLFLRVGLPHGAVHLRSASPSRRLGSRLPTAPPWRRSTRDPRAPGDSHPGPRGWASRSAWDRWVIGAPPRRSQRSVSKHRCKASDEADGESAPGGTDPRGAPRKTGIQPPGPTAATVSQPEVWRSKTLRYGRRPQWVCELGEGHPWVRPGLWSPRCGSESVAASAQRRVRPPPHSRHRPPRA